MEWDASVLLMNSVWYSLTLCNSFSVLNLFSIWLFQVPSKYHLFLFNHVYLYVCTHLWGADAYVWGSDDSLSCWSPPSTTTSETGSLCCSHLSRPGSDLRAPRASRVSTSHLAIRGPRAPTCAFTRLWVFPSCIFSLCLAVLGSSLYHIYVSLAPALESATVLEHQLLQAGHGVRSRS